MPSVLARPAAPLTETRAAPRRAASEVPSITEVFLSHPRTAAVLIDISRTGMLIECERPFRPEMQVTVTFLGGFAPASASGRIARTAVSAMTQSGIRYHVGIAFTQAIELPDMPVPAAKPSVHFNRW